MIIIVTGAMGFIGANIVHALHKEGMDIVAVDNLESGNKFANVAGVPLLDYCDKHDFLNKFRDKYWGNIAAVLHQGACSSTVEQNGRYMLENNYQYSAAIMEICQTQNTPLIYASSAAVYGLAEVCSENDDLNPLYKPLNVYGYSKWLFDQRVRRYWAENTKSPPIVGLRYFNVYGQRESHKGRMSSVVFHLFGQLTSGEPMKLFDGFAGYAAGKQKRDFIHVDDAVAVNMFFLKAILANQNKSGIYNCGTGVASPFSDIPLALIQAKNKTQTSVNINELVAQNLLTFIPFPDDLKGRYQSYTEANIEKLREAGFEDNFKDIFEGVRAYGKWLLDNV